MTSGGIEDIILSLSYQSASRKIEEPAVKDGTDYGVRIRYAVEAIPLGTGGAFKNAEAHIDSRLRSSSSTGDVLSANLDSFGGHCLSPARAQSDRHPGFDCRSTIRPPTDWWRPHRTAG